jgi:phosphoribosyl-ATP pyrophosphohydrolase
MSKFTLTNLDAIIALRTSADAGTSYTKSLLDAGVAHAAKKFGEEAVEAVIAAMEHDKTALIKESADVLYHLLVLMRAGGVSLEDVQDELQRRTAQSGHQEKASRGA